VRSSVVRAPSEALPAGVPSLEDISVFDGAPPPALEDSRSRSPGAPDAAVSSADAGETVSEPDAPELAVDVVGAEEVGVAGGVGGVGCVGGVCGAAGGEGGAGGVGGAGTEELRELQLRARPVARTMARLRQVLSPAKLPGLAIRSVYFLTSIRTPPNPANPKDVPAYSKCKSGAIQPQSPGKL
jgi:hypothetical protein